MHHRPLFAFTLFILAGLGDAAATAPHQDPWTLCARAVAQAERAAGIPPHLLQAIALAESGRTSKQHQARLAWPWTVMAEGNGRYLPTKEAAVATVEALQSRGVRNIDVGCMQVNLRYHPDAFAGLAQAFDPTANAAYAARFLKDLHRETGSWTAAAGRYHSATPEYNGPYRAKVTKLWQQQAGKAATLAAAGSGTPRPTTGPGTRRQVSMKTANLGTMPTRGITRRSRLLFGSGPRTFVRDAAATERFEARRRQQLEAWRTTTRRLTQGARFH